MKKIFTLIAAALMTMGANAQTTTVGAEDNSADWWTAFSDYYTVNEGDTAIISFTNYSSKVENWHNWVLVATPAGAQRGADGYKEYFAARPDNWGWGDYWDASTLSNNYNWDTFKDDMDSSNVAISLVNHEGRIYGVATIGTNKDSIYIESFVSTDTGAKDFSFFLTAEKAHLTDVKVTYFTPADSTVQAAYKDYSTQYANYNDPDWGMVDGAKFNIDFYGTDSLIIRNWMNQNVDLCVAYDPATGIVKSVNNVGNDPSYWAYADNQYYAWVACKAYGSESSWVSPKTKELFLTFSWGTSWDNYHLTWADASGIKAVSVDDADASAVTKSIENGKVVIAKNGKKYTAAGAQIK